MRVVQRRMRISSSENVDIAEVSVHEVILVLTVKHISHYARNRHPGDDKVLGMKTTIHRTKV